MMQQKRINNRRAKERGGVFGLLDEEVYDAVINHSDELAHIAKFYNLKSAS